MTKSNIGIFLLVTAIIVCLAGLAFAVVKLSIDTGGSGNSKTAIECTGQIAVPLAGIGDSQIKNLDCKPEDCGLFAFSIFQEEGQIKMYVDGKLSDSQTWKSTLGNNQDFTLKSSCYDSPREIEIKLFEENKAVDNEKVMLS